MPSILSPPDYPPIFPLGFHCLSMADVERMCVDHFPLSVGRRALMNGLTTFVQRLIDSAVTGEIWVDGSFATEKIEPKDVDVLLRCQGALYNNGTADQRAAINWVIDNQKPTLRCDSYVLMEYPEGDPLYEEGLWWHSYWHTKWGFSREEEPKRIIVIPLTGVVS